MLRQKPDFALSVIESRGWPLRGLVFVVLGGVAALGQAPTNYWWLGLLALAAAFALMPTTTGRRAFWHGWALGVGYFAISLRWIISPFMVDVERHGWMAPFALIFMAAGFALFWGGAALLAHRVWRKSWLGLPLALTLAEVLRSLILTGFPWALIGHAFVRTPFSQLAAFGGAHLLTLLFVVLAGVLARRHVPSIIGAAAIATAGWLLLTPEPVPPAPDAPVVRLVQPNAPQDQKWDPVMSRMFYERMIGYTGEGDVPDLVVWPESAIAMLLNYADGELAEMSDAARGAPVIVGANREESGLYYNSFVHLGRSGFIESVYDKQHLVPFGEYTPAGDLLHEIGIRGFGSAYGGGFSSGQGVRTLDIPGIGPIRPLICYEGIFAEEVGGTGVRPVALVLITNDAWFGKAAGPYQHLAQARLRAIEQGVPMVRVANTGVSAMIDAKGLITGRIALNSAGYLDVPLPPVAPPTIYSRFGEWPMMALLGLLSIGLWWRGKQNSIDHRKKTT